MTHSTEHGAAGRPGAANYPGAPGSAELRAHFPVLERTVRDGRPLVYLDSGATSQRPREVVAAETDFIFGTNAPVHRGAYELAEDATDAYEDARATIAAFIGAREDQLALTSGATMALNEIAMQLGDRRAGQFAVTRGDVVVVTEVEHHANLVPWQELCRRTGAELRWFAATDDGRIDYDSYVPTGDEKVFAFTHQSNVTGAITDVRQMVSIARTTDAVVVLDACQSVPHQPVDVADLGVDALAFSGHKMCGPTGVGALWLSDRIRDALPPAFFGGSMVETVHMDATTYTAPPQRFEAGTQMVSQVIGLAEACRFLDSIGMEAIAAHEHELTAYCLDRLAEIDGVRIVGPTGMSSRGSAVSFTVDGIHPHDLGQVVDDHGVAIRVGHHCAWPVHRTLGVQASARASMYLYNTRDDIDRLVAGITAAQRFFAR